MMTTKYVLVLTALLPSLLAPAFADDAVAIGSRRELFVDRLFVGELNGATLKLHEPQLAELLVKDARPHGHYATVLQAEGNFQFYYRGDKDPKVTWHRGISRRRSHALCRESGRSSLDAAEAGTV